MERVTGIGGFFFRARDPEALTAWYQQHLGIGPAPGEMKEMPWAQEAGPTVFAPFSATTDYFAADKAWMINLRVRDLDAMVAQLRAGGVEASEITDYPYGRFARIHDPEGNAIELWQPKEPPRA